MGKNWSTKAAQASLGRQSRANDTGTPRERILNEMRGYNPAPKTVGSGLSRTANGKFTPGPPKPPGINASAKYGTKGVTGVGKPFDKAEYERTYDPKIMEGLVDAKYGKGAMARARAETASLFGGVKTAGKGGGGSWNESVHPRDNVGKFTSG